MSTPAEHGLSAYLGYGQDMQGTCDQAITSLETTIASMEKDQFSGAATAGYKQAMDHLEAARAALSTSVTALDQSLTVKDAYTAAAHTGSRDAVLAE